MVRFIFFFKAKTLSFNDVFFNEILGDVYLTCHSDQAVFVQSFFLDNQAGRKPGDVVHKIYPDTTIQVFDLTHTYREITKQADEARAGIYSKFLIFLKI